MESKDQAHRTPSLERRLRALQILEERVPLFAEENARAGE